MQWLPVLLACLQLAEGAVRCGSRGDRAEDGERGCGAAGVGTARDSSGAPGDILGQGEHLLKVERSFWGKESSQTWRASPGARRASAESGEQLLGQGEHLLNVENTFWGKESISWGKESS